MIDTIVLTLNQNMFRITEHDRFEPSTKGLYNSSYSFGGRGYLTCKQNPTPNELRNGIYKPRLTITKRFYKGIYQTMLKIEFSAPKLLFKNNLDELDDDNFEAVISVLLQKLKDMGVLVLNEILTIAPVSSIHYSKNIKLLNGLTPFTLLKEIQKSNISQRLDFNQSDFRNEGHSFKFRANSYEVAFYDKLKDIEQAKISEKRAIEKDNVIQMSLFDEVKQQQRRQSFEILRMEVRLNQRQKIKQILRLIGNGAEPIFQSLFKKEIAQNILLHYLNLIEESYPKTLFFNAKSNEDFISQFIIDNPKAKLKEVTTALGFHNTLQEAGVRDIRKLFIRYPKRSWYRFINEMNSYNYIKTNQSPFMPIRASIEEMMPLRAVDFQGKMSNNVNIS